MKNQLMTMIKMLSLAGAGWSSKGDSEKKKSTNKVVVFFLIFIVIPLVLAFGFLSFYLAFLLNGTGKEASVLNLGMGIAGMTMLFFGFLMIPSVFYFADDIDYLMPMPIKPINIVNAKLFTTYIWENLTAIFVFLPMMIGYSIGTHVKWYFWIYGIVILMTLSLIPLLYGTIINMLLIRFTSFGKNKNVLSYVMSLLSMFLSIAISMYLLNNLYSGNGNVFYTLAISSNSFVEILNRIFPFMSYASSAMTTGNIGDLLIYFLMNIGFFVVYYVIARMFYYEGLLKLSSGNKNGKAVRFSDIKKKSKQKSQFYSLLKKEFINLFLNPSYFSACISPNIIIPMILFLVPKTNIWENIQHYLYLGLSNILKEQYLFIFIVIIALLCYGLNYIAATSFSREGFDYQSMKYLPIDYSLQIKVKLMTSIIISSITFLLSLILIIANLKIKMFTILIGGLVGFALSLFVLELSIWLDLYNPTLNWDDEQKAVKQNFNGMLGLIFSVVLAIIFGIAFVKLNLNFATVGFLLFLGLLLIDTILYAYLIWNCENYFDEM